jgi:hypothetical protein
MSPMVESVEPVVSEPQRQKSEMLFATLEEAEKRGSKIEEGEGEKDDRKRSARLSINRTRGPNAQSLAARVVASGRRVAEVVARLAEERKRRESQTLVSECRDEGRNAPEDPSPTCKG